MSLKSNFEYIRDWCNHRFLRRDEKVDVDLSNYYTKDEVDSNISSATPDISVSMYSSSGSKSDSQTISNNGQFELSRVATSGSYNDLSNKPTIPAAQVQSDWNAASGMGVILNKPDLSGYMTVEDYQTDEEVVAAALNDLDGRITTVVEDTKAKLASKQDAIEAVQVNIDGTSGTPSGSASMSGNTLQFSFSGIKGNDGATGQQGPVGPAGANGTNGADGKSAYQIWLDAGHQGTEADFLASLQGNPGSSQDYPFELENSLNGGTTKALTAEQGKVLDGKITKLGHEVDGINLDISDAGVYQVNTSSSVETSSGTRLRILLKVSSGCAMTASCSKGKGCAAAVYNSVSNALYAGSNGKLQEIAGSYVESVSAVITVDGIISISLCKSDSTSFTAEEKAEFIAATSITIKRQGITDIVPYQLNRCFIGKGTLFSSESIYGLKPGRTYRLVLPKTSWPKPTMNTNYNQLALSNKYNGSSEDIVSVKYGSTIVDYYDFTIPDESDYIGVGGRADSDVSVQFFIYDVTDILSVSSDVGYRNNSYEQARYVIRNDVNGGFSLVDNPNGQRIRIIFPISIGYKVFAKTTLPSGISGGVWATELLAARAASVDCLQSFVSGYSTAPINATATVAGWACISLTNGSSAISDDLKEEMLQSLSIYWGGGLMYNQNDLDKRVAALEENIENGDIEYGGSRVDLRTHKYSISRIHQYTSTGKNMQGFAISGNIFVSLSDTGICQLSRLEDDGTLTELSSFNLGSYGSTNHANIASFGKQYPTGNSFLPAMYVGNTTAGYRNCLVESIEEDNATLIQTISIGTYRDSITSSWGCEYVVGDDGFFYVLGRSNSRLYVAKFYTPDISIGDVALDLNDAIEFYYLNDYGYPIDVVMQGACVVNGLLILPLGYGTSASPSQIRIWNLSERRMQNEINLSTVTSGEIEDVDVSGGILYARYGNGNLYKLVF